MGQRWVWNGVGASSMALLLAMPGAWGQTAPLTEDTAETPESCEGLDQDSVEEGDRCEETETPEAPSSDDVVEPEAEAEPEVEAEPFDAGDTLRITVTAELTPEDAQDVPVSLTTFSETQIEDANITTLDDVADRTPNFTFFPGGANRTAAFYSLRGVNNFNAFSRDAVGFFVDDVPYDFAGFIDQDFTDLERIEVLRGPQNTLYGRSSSGGVVNIVTRRPTNEPEFRTALSYGSYGDFETRLSLSGPIQDDELLFRLSGSYSTQDGFVNNQLLNDDVDGGRTFTGQGQLWWTPNEEWDVRLNVSFGDYREGANPYVLVGAADPFNAPLTFNGFNDLVTNAQSLRAEYSTDAIRFTSITAHRFSSQRAAFDQDGAAADFLINAPDFSSRVFTQEFRLQSPEGAERLQWILGGYFESGSFRNDRRIINGAANPPANQGTITSDGTSTNRSLAAFGQASYDLTEALTLTAGLRYENTRASINFDQTFTTPGGLTFPTVQVDNAETTGSALLPRFVAEYRFSPDLLAYGSITRGYRPPGASFEPITADAALFDAETSWNYEIGLKSAWLEDRLIVNLAGFYSDTSNFQFPSINPGTGAVAVSNADIRTLGAELEVIARPISGLELSAGLGLVSAEFRNGNETFTGAPLAGNRVPFSTDITYNLAAQYRSEAGLFGRLEVIGFGNTVFNDLNTDQQEAFALVNARLGYEFDNYGIYVSANNLFNTEYVTQAFDAGAGLAGTFGPPRTFGVQFRASF